MVRKNGTMAVLLVLVMVCVSFAPLAANVAGQEIDSDGDGFSDKYERQVGTDPEDPNDYPGKNSGGGGGGSTSFTERFQFDLLASSRIVGEDQAISVAVYVRKDGELVGQRLVYMSIYQATGQRLELISEDKAVLEDGRATFQYTHPTTGLLFFVATMEEYRAGLSSQTTVASLMAKRGDGRAGYVSVAVYQLHIATIDAEFLHLLPGMAARLIVKLYDLKADINTTIADKWAGAVSPMHALDELYQPSSGTAYLTGSGPGGFGVTAQVQCGTDGGVYEPTVITYGEHIFTVSGYSDFRYFTDMASVNVHNPVLRSIAMMSRFNLFDTAQIQLEARRVDPVLGREDFDRYMREAGGDMAQFARSHPSLLAPILGQVFYYVLYMQGGMALVLKRDVMLYNGTGFSTYTFGVPGEYRVLVTENDAKLPTGAFSYAVSVPIVYQQKIEVLTDYIVTTFPNKITYFPAESVKLTTMFMSGDKVVRDMPVAIYVDNIYQGQQKVKDGEFVIQHDLGKMPQGGHIVKTIPITSQDTQRIIDAFGVMFWNAQWNGNAVFFVRGIGIYMDLPGKAVSGRPFSFRLLALDAPMQPCIECYFKVFLLNGDIKMFMTSGTTDENGAAVVTFDYPELYFDSIKVDIDNGKGAVSVTKPIEPRAQQLSGIVVTNKPLYKAGETVMMRFLVWNADLVGPGSGELDVKVTDPVGREIAREKVDLDAYGSASLEVPIAVDQKDGDYKVQVWVKGREVPLIDKNFKVEAYKTPSVEVVFENKKDVVDENTQNYTVPFRVKYMFGKDVTEGDITYEFGHINKGQTTMHKGGTGTLKVNGTWPLNIKFNLDNSITPGDLVYIKIDFTDRFGHATTGKLQVMVTESVTLFNLGVKTDKEEYRPDEPVNVRISLNQEIRALGRSTFTPMAGEKIGLSIQAPDDSWTLAQIVIGQDGNWTGTLSELGVSVGKFLKAGNVANFKMEARADLPVQVTKSVQFKFRTVEPVLSTDNDWYEAGSAAVIYIAIRDLVNEAFLGGAYSVKVHRLNDEKNLLFSSVGKLETSSLSMTWNVPETLSTGAYVVDAQLGQTHLMKEIRVEDQTPRSIKLTSSGETYKPGDRIELKVDFAKPFTGRLYIDYMAEGNLQGQTLMFNNPTKLAVVDITTGNWRSPIWACAYFVASTGEMVSDKIKVDREEVGLKIKVDTSKVEYMPGDIMTLTIEVMGNDGKLVPGALLSLAVIDASIFDIANEFDDGAWMASFGVPGVMDRAYSLVSDQESSNPQVPITFDQVAAFYGIDASARYNDFDNDGLGNYEEFSRGTSMVTADSDSDWLPDGWEVKHGLDPLNGADGLQDIDGDGMPSGWEMHHGLDPLVADSGSDQDNDTMTALSEYQGRTNPNDWDTDGDGLPDGWEVRYGLDPLDPSDAQGDLNGNGVTNIEEFWMQTVPGRPIDYLLTSETDTDSDGLSDLWEARNGLNPFDPSDATKDCDSDGWTNLEEFIQGTDPKNPNTDDDRYEFDSTDPNPLWNDDPFEWGDFTGTGDEDNGGSGGQGSGQGSGNGGGGNGGSGGSNGGGSGSGGSGSSGNTGGSSGSHGGGIPDLGDHDGPGGLLDSDGDGLTDLEEQALGTNPFKSDTDGDGIPDPVDKDALNPDKPVIPGGGGTTEEPPSLNPFIPHEATSKEIESFHERKWFTDTAYWAPDLLMEKGVLRVGILLPDNIGRWRVKASAWTQDLRSGETIIEVNSYKGMFVEPVVPTGIFQDDEVTFKARVYNLDDTPKDIKVILTAGPWLRAFGENERTVKFGAREVKEIPFFVKIDGMHEQEVKFGVSDGTTTDAVTAKTFVQPNGAKKTQHFAGSIEDEVTMFTEFFPEYIEGSNNATLKLSAGYDGLFMHGATVMAQYPYDCTEQTMTKLLTNVLLWRYDEANGNLRGDEREMLRKTIYENLNRLLALQHKDGGWGWWEKDTSDPWMTSYVLFGYSVVREEGFHVDSNSLNGAWEYLLKAAVYDTAGGSMWMGTSWLKHKDDTMTATVYYSMVASGYPDKLLPVKAHLDNMFKSGVGLDAYTVTLYGLALEAQGLNTTPVEEWLVQNMVDANHWAKGNSLGGEVETTGWATYFMVKTGTTPKEIRPTLRWLSSQRIGGAWSTTSTTVANLFAVTEVMRTAKQPKADIKVLVNGAIVKEFRGLNDYNFWLFNKEFESFDVGRYMVPGKPNEVRIVKTGEGDLFYELTDVQYLRAGVKVTFQAAAMGRVGDLVDIWMEVKPDATKTLDIIGLTVGVPQAPGLVLVNTRKVKISDPGSTEESIRYIHTFAAREQGRYTLAPLVISYQLDAGEGPSGVIRDYFGPLDVLVKVPLSELKKKPGLVEEDLGDLVNKTRDNIKDKVEGLRDEVKDKINQTKKRIEDVKDITTGKTEEVRDKITDTTNGTIKPIDNKGSIIDETPIKKRTGGRSMDVEDVAEVKVQVNTDREEQKVTVVDFVPVELEVISVGNGGKVQDGKITWEVDPEQDTTLSYKVKAKEEFNGDLGRAVVLGTESIEGVSNMARMVFTTKNFVVVRDAQTSAYAGDLVAVSLTVMTTGDGLWYAALEDYAPAGAVIDEDSVAANLDGNVLSYKVTGNRATFFIRKAVNLTLTYNYRPSLVGNTIAPPAKAYPMYDPANTASSDSYAIAVDYKPPETEGGGGASGGVAPTVKKVGPKLSLGQEDIVIGEAEPRAKSLTTISAYVHNNGDTAVQTTVSVYDQPLGSKEKRLIGYQVAVIAPGKSTMVKMDWRPSFGDHSLVVQAAGAGSTVQATKAVTVSREETVAGGIGQVTPESVMNGPVLLVILVLSMVISAGVAISFGKAKAEAERKELEAAARRRSARKVRKTKK